ncbi:MAG: Kae1-like domain-containing protein [Eubacteriales bacterium]
MKQNFTVLGIDTSNYTTSVSLIDENGEILADFRKLLVVKKGERGLRQSDAVFQHMINFPQIFDEMLHFFKIQKHDLKTTLKLKAVAVSEKPRPIEGSYMPCFRAGESFAKILAGAFSLPLFRFSHQEGHIESALYKNHDKISGNFLCWHLSGGTCELLLVKNNDFSLKADDFTNFYDISIIGGSLDISLGQMIDRIGVKLNMPFPAGKYIDNLALLYDLRESEYEKRFAKIKQKDLYFNISGIETQITRYIEEHLKESENDEFRSYIAKQMLDKTAELILQVSLQAMEKTNIYQIVFSGGVSASKYIREKLEKNKVHEKYKFIFSDAELSSDNAVGIGLLGRKLLL